MAAALPEIAAVFQAGRKGNAKAKDVFKGEIFSFPWKLQLVSFVDTS